VADGWGEYIMADVIRVLYVDDEPDLLEIGKVFLEDSGEFSVATVCSASAALELLQQEQFDAIISDYQMPGMDGIQLLVEVRTRFGPIPFILFTGKGREEVVIQAINSGADFYLQKGGEPGAQFAELSHKIKSAVSRQRADDTLRKSDEKYRHLIEHSNEAIVVAQDGMLKLVNHKTIEFTGYSEQELLSMQFSAFIHPKDRAMVVDRYQKRMRGEEGPSRYAFRLSSKDGSTRWVDISVSAIDWEGRPATLNFLTDITERKMVDDSLQEEQQFSKLMLDSLPGIFYLYTYPENRLIRWNKQHETLLGYTAEEIKGKLGTDLHLPEYKDAVLKAIDEVMEHGQSSIESTLLAKDGRLIPFFFTGVRFEAPGQLYFMGIGIDITERKLAEQKLASAKQRLEEAHHLAHIGTWDWVIETDTVTWSEELYNIAGRDPSLPAPTYAELPRSYTSSSWKRLSAAVTNTLTTGEPYNLELEMIRPDGSIRSTNAFGGVQRDGNEKIIGLQGTVQDFTERKREEEALRINEKRLQITQEIGHIGCWEYDIKTNMMWGSEEGCHLFGYPRMAGSFPIENFASCITEPELVLKAFNDLINEGKEYDLDFIINPKDGSAKKTLHSIGILEKDEKGNPAKVKGINQDITERKRAEEALRESEERFRLTLDATNDGIWDRDIPTGTAFFSPRWYTMLGYGPDEMPGSYATWQSLIHPEDIGAAEQAIHDHIGRGRGGYYRLEYRMRTKDGNWKWILARGRVVGWDADKKPVRIVGTHTDITERKVAEAALAESERHFRAIFEASPVPLAMNDEHGNITFLNRAFVQAVGYTANEIPNLADWWPRAYPDPQYRQRVADNWQKNLEEVKHTGRPFTPMELIIRCKDDSVRTFLGSATSLKENFAGTHLVILYDITDRKLAEETIRHALAEKEVLLREIHHRVKNNLAGIISLIGLQASSVTDPDIISLLKDLETRIRSIALVHDSLYLTKDLARVNVAGYTENLTGHLFQVYGTNANIQCRIEMEEITMSIETAIPCGLVMAEIVTNSLKHAFPKTFSCVEIRGEPCTIALTLQRDGSDYLLGVADNGIGMPEGTDVTKHHSLGLYLIRLIVEHQLRGRLEISTAGGTAYTIRFPEPAAKERNPDE
jgi:hypothetical protein